MPDEPSDSPLNRPFIGVDLDIEGQHPQFDALEFRARLSESKALETAAERRKSSSGYYQIYSET